MLPVLVRGRRLGPDLVGATLWAAGVASATQALAGTMAWQPEMRGLVAGAAVSVALSRRARRVTWRRVRALGSVASP